MRLAGAVATVAVTLRLPLPAHAGLGEDLARCQSSVWPQRSPPPTRAAKAWRPTSRRRTPIPNECRRAGLADRFWEDGAHLTGRGEQVFQGGRRAVAELTGLDQAQPAIADLRREIVAVGEELAAIAVDEALGKRPDPDRLERAREAMAAGAAALAEGQPGRALDHYKRAWAIAQTATKR